MTFAALAELESIMAPAILALVTGVVLSPLSNFWERRGLSPLGGALIGLVGTLVVLAALALIFQPVVEQMVEKAPKVWADMKDSIEFVQGLVRGLEEARGEVEKAVAAEPDAAGAVGAVQEAPEEDGLNLPTVSDALLLAPAILSQILIFAGVLFFFLLTRHELYEWIANILPGRDSKSAISLREAERLVSRYFITVALINAVLGIATAAMLRLYGMPGALSLGLVAFLLNFILYLGPAIFFCALLFAGIGAYDGVMVVVPAFTFLAFNATEGSVRDAGAGWPAHATQPAAGVPGAGLWHMAMGRAGRHRGNPCGAVGSGVGRCVAPPAPGRTGRESGPATIPSMTPTPPPLGERPGAGLSPCRQGTLRAPRAFHSQVKEKAMPENRHHTPGSDERKTPTQTEVPAGSGDAGASDKPQRLERHAEARLSNPDRVLIRLLWIAAAVILLFVIFVR